jgi:hypothetical protein
MTTEQKEQKMATFYSTSSNPSNPNAKVIARCGAAVCGFTVNSKNAANCDFRAVALAAGPPAARLVVWTRSNLVAHALGKVGRRSESD